MVESSVPDSLAQSKWVGIDENDPEYPSAKESRKIGVAWRLATAGMRQDAWAISAFDQRRILWDIWPADRRRIRASRHLGIERGESK